MRRDHKWSATRITFELNKADVTISRRTVTRLLAQLGLNRRRFIDPNGDLNRRPKTIVAKRPGHMVHVDVKKVGRIPDGGGWRAHGRGSDQARAAARAKTKAGRGGCVYLHSAIDGHTRMAYTEPLSDEKAATAVGFVHRARAWFAAHGIARLERVVTDIGACYRADVFTRALLGTEHKRTKPYTPKHNGKVERYNRILAEEFLYARTWTSDSERSAAVAVWNVHYNYHRPHSACGPTTSCTRPGKRHHRCGLIQLTGQAPARAPTGSLRPALSGCRGTSAGVPQRPRHDGDEAGAVVQTHSMSSALIAQHISDNVSASSKPSNPDMFTMISWPTNTSMADAAAARRPGAVSCSHTSVTGSAAVTARTKA